MLKDIFKAYDIRGVYPDLVNEDAAFAIGFGTATFLANHPERPSGDAGDIVLVSQDMRVSSPSLAEALSDGIRRSLAEDATQLDEKVELSSPRKFCQ